MVISSGLKKPGNVRTAADSHGHFSRCFIFDIRKGPTASGCDHCLDYFRYVPLSGHVQRRVSLVDRSPVRLNADSRL